MKETHEHIVLRNVRSEPRPPKEAEPILRSKVAIHGAQSVIQLEAHDISHKDVFDFERQNDVISMAPTIPMKLVYPLSVNNLNLTDIPEITWGIKAVSVENCNINAEKVIVAVIDTGIDDQHPAFKSIDITKKNFTEEDPQDLNGHGTHCAGIIFGQTIDSRYSVAPSIRKVLIAKALDRNGNGSSKSIASSILWALQQGAHIISMSLGFDFPGYVKSLNEVYGMPIQQATSKALEGYRKNIRLFDTLSELVKNGASFWQTSLLIAATGNESQREGNPTYRIDVSPPAAANGIVAVGAVGKKANADLGVEIAPFSNTNPDLTAPGVEIYSTLPGNSFGLLSGTSMATPFVAGIAALWAAKMMKDYGQVHPDALIHNLLTNTIRSKNWNRSDYGTGLIQAP